MPCVPKPNALCMRVLCVPWLGRKREWAEGAPVAKLKAAVARRCIRDAEAGLGAVPQTVCRIPNAAPMDPAPVITDILCLSVPVRDDRTVVCIAAGYDNGQVRVFSQVAGPTNIHCCIIAFCQRGGKLS